MIHRQDGLRRRYRLLLPLGALVTLLAPPAAGAQTDYFNTDAGRPVRIEDAYPTERYAFELQVAPVRVERSSAGSYSWAVEPEVAYGVLPRTHVEVGFPLVHHDLPARDGLTALAGVHISALHNLNVETTSLPALALAASVLLPAGGLAPDESYGSFTALATRTHRWARLHLNAQYTLGAEPEAGAGDLELSRWLAGMAVDRTFPLQSLLLTAELYARRPLSDAEDVQWNAGAGGRFQLIPRVTLDAGFGRALTGDNRAWFATAGASYAFGVRSLIPSSRR